MHLFVYIPTYVTWFSDVNIDALTPLFSLLSEYSSTAVVWDLSTAQYQCTFFLITFCCFLFCFLFHLRFSHSECFMLAHCCLSVVQILIFHVCSFFPTHTSCIQRLYKGQFKILQSYFVFIIKCHWRRNTKYSTLFVHMCTYGR